jgi:hypothetical protein
MARIDVQKLQEEDNWFSYDTFVRAFGRRVAVEKDDGEYQGDSYRLIADGVEPDQRYGVLIFGWGSCSGCDWFLDCSSTSDFQELADHLQDSIKWFSDKETLRKYMQEHDWEGDWVWGREGFQEFHRKVVEFLDSDLT